MKGLLSAAIVFACAGSIGCGLDCAPSSGIQVTLVPQSGVDGARIARLRVAMSINGGVPKSVDVTPTRPLTTSGALLLQPDPAPADRYSIMVTVQGLAANGALVAIGSTAGDVSAVGCNRLEARLTPLPGGNVDAGGTDGSHVLPDLSMPPPPDMSSSCTSLTPDEDSDARGDTCDLCPADFDPSPDDSDGDGLPDACDPDVGRVGNKLLYFEPFNSDNHHWSGKVETFRGDLSLDTQGTNTLAVGNSVDALPINVRAQATIFVGGFYAVTGNPVDADIGIYLGTNGNLNSGTGILCSMNTNKGSGDTLDLNVMSNGSAGPPISVSFTLAKNQLYRLRLTQRGSNYICEASANNLLTKTVMGTVNVAPTAPLFMALHASNIEAEANSIVAESVLP
jgi:hypothetical protein